MALTAAINRVIQEGTSTSASLSDIGCRFCRIWTGGVLQSGFRGQISHLTSSLLEAWSGVYSRWLIGESCPIFGPIGPFLRLSWLFLGTMIKMFYET